MSERNPETSADETDFYTADVVRGEGKPLRSLRRLGCAIILVLWFALLLMPCFLIVLATQQQIVISQGDLPGQQIRIWLIMEPDERGLGISRTFTRPFTANSDGEGMCLQTVVNYVLWEGTGEAASYCDCYARTAQNETWSLVESYIKDCPG